MRKEVLRQVVNKKYNDAQHSENKNQHRTRSAGLRRRSRLRVYRCKYVPFFCCILLRVMFIRLCCCTINTIRRSRNPRANVSCDAARRSLSRSGHLFQITNTHTLLLLLLREGQGVPTLRDVLSHLPGRATSPFFISSTRRRSPTIIIPTHAPCTITLWLVSLCYEVTEK